MPNETACRKAENLKNGGQNRNSKLRRVTAGVYAPEPRWDRVFLKPRGWNMKFRPKVVRRIPVLLGYVGLAILHVLRADIAALLCYVIILTGYAMEVWKES